MPPSRLRLVLACAAAVLVAVPVAGNAASAPAASRAGATRAAAGRTPAPAAAWHPRPATYGIATEKDVLITMSDGVRLDADVLRPALADGKPAPGRFPVVLTQTPYNKNSGSLAFNAPNLVQRGYVQVIVDVRGTGGSGGQWDSFGTREQRDGYELVEWCAARARPWSDGRVALHGTSYGALNQLLTAEQDPPGLAAEFPVVPMGDAYRDVTFSGGQVNASFIPLWLGLVTGTGLLPPGYAGSDPVDAATTVAGHAGDVPGFQAAAVANAATGGDEAYDGPFYRLRSPIERIGRIHVPTFVVGGWFDLFQRGEPMIYAALRAHDVPTRLLMGPWYHITAGDGLPAQGVPALPDLELRWFDHFVRGVPDPSLDRDVPPVTYYQNGSGRWRHADAWPPAGTRFRPVYLAGPASPGSPGRLQPHRAGGEGPDSLPWVGVTGACSRGTVQWTAGAGAGTPCETDQRPNDAYSLSYDLPVSHGLTLLGPVAARLFVSTNGRDGQITARLEDVSPNGSVTQMTAGWIVLSLRALDRRRSVWRDGVLVQPYHPFTRASARPMPSGVVEEADVEIFPTGWYLPPGHVLRLTLQPADLPHLAAPVPQTFDSAGCVLSLWHDARHQSRLVLPGLG